MKFLKAMFTGFSMLHWVAAILGFLRYGVDCFKGDPNPGPQLLCGGVQFSINCFVYQILPISDIVIKFVDPLEIAESLLEKYPRLKLLTKLKKLPVLPLPVPAAAKNIENENVKSALVLDQDTLLFLSTLLPLLVIFPASLCCFRGR